jgi:hypothetical protein
MDIYGYKASVYIPGKVIGGKFIVKRLLGKDLKDKLLELTVRVKENSESDYFSDSDGPSSKKAKLSSLESSSSADPLQDKRPFPRFMKEEKLVEVVQDWETYPIGSICEIKANGELRIANEKTHVIISKVTQDEMKKQKLWGQRMDTFSSGAIL